MFSSSDPVLIFFPVRFQAVADDRNKTLKGIVHYDSRSSDFFTPTFFTTQPTKDRDHMTSKKQLLFAYGLAIHLLLVGIICYAAFPARAPDQPLRKMYQTNAGKVLFDHFTHTDASGYGASCFDCHHHPSDDDSALIACGECHQAPAEDGSKPERCLDCHDESDIEETQMILSCGCVSQSVHRVPRGIRERTAIQFG